MLTEEEARRRADAEIEDAYASGYLRPLPTSALPPGKASASPFTGRAGDREDGAGAGVSPAAGSSDAAAGDGARGGGGGALPRPLAVAPVGFDGEVYEQLCQAVGVLGEVEPGAGRSLEVGSLHDVWCSTVFCKSMVCCTSELAVAMCCCTVVC